MCAWMNSRHLPLFPLPLHVSHEHSDEVEDLLQAVGRRLQDLVGEAAEEDKEISQVLRKELCRRTRILVITNSSY